ncbi:MAG TPA: Trp biosynthesis-associated membrane protein [Sporichthyaceae bacterium]|nr:Trp biosynthesis-associated membrane protein [Sporichthyaceae bacterium]
MTSAAGTNGRRELVAALAGCVLGAGVVLFAADRPWVHARAGQGALQVPLSVRGGSLTPVTPALAVVGLAGALGLVATRGVLRRLTGVLVCASGVVAAVAALGSVHPGAGDLTDRAGAALGTASGTVSAIRHTGWGWVAVLGSVVFALAGAAAVARGPRWPGMSARYETPVAAPARAAAPDDSALEQWRALDRGEDPTL